MKTVGKIFEQVFNEYFNNQQTYKHKIDLLKSINNDWNSQNLNNLFSNVNITQIMIEICKSLNINLNYLVGIENNKFITNYKENFMNETILEDKLIYNLSDIQKHQFISISKSNIIKFQTSQIGLFFDKDKKYIVLLKSGLKGIVSIINHHSQTRLFIKFEKINNDFFTIRKNEILVIAEEIENSNH